MAGIEGTVDALEQAFRQSLGFRGWLHARRWCGEAVGPRTELAVKDRALLVESAAEVIAFFLVVAREENTSVPMHVPLAIASAKPDPEAFELSAGGTRGYVTEGERSAAYARFLVDGFRDRLSIRTDRGDSLHFLGEALGAFRALEPFADDSSNVLVRLATAAGTFVFKSYKRLDVGNREPDILQRLHKKGFPHVPRYRGELALGKGTDRLVLGVATEHTEATDAFAWLTAGWRDELGGARVADFERASLDFVVALGEATAGLHDALIDRHAGPFQAETFTEADAEVMTKRALGNLSDSLRRLAALAKGPDTRLGGLAAKSRELVFAQRERIESALAGLEAGIGTVKAVTHADLHLAQILRTAGGRILFIDFEGEPERAPGQRSVKLPPLRDVATMNRSFAYVKHYVWREATRGDATAAWRLLHRQDWSPAEEGHAHRLAAWESVAIERFARAYLAHAGPYASLEPDTALRAIRGWAIEKALYELRYELKHRPQNIFIPLEGVLSLAALGPTA